VGRGRDGQTLFHLEVNSLGKRISGLRVLSSHQVGVVISSQTFKVIFCKRLNLGQTFYKLEGSEIRVLTM
jgi:hypothetical protein